MIWHKYDASDPNTWPPKEQSTAIVRIDGIMLYDSPWANMWCQDIYMYYYVYQDAYYYDYPGAHNPNIRWVTMSENDITHWMIPDVDEVQTTVWRKYDKDDPKTWPEHQHFVIVRYIDEDFQLTWNEAYFMVDKREKPYKPTFFIEYSKITHWFEPDVNEVEGR